MISASLVKELREKTGAGMLDCKKALEACDANLDAAVDWLREKGISKAAKKADRIAAEGLAAILVEGNKAAIVEVNSETDFVAKNSEFTSMVDEILKAIINNDVKTNEDVLNVNCSEGTINDLIISKTAKIGEKLSFRRFTKVEKNDNEVFGSYIHMGGKIAVLVTLEGANEEVAKDVAALTKYFLDKWEGNPNNKLADRIQAANYWFNYFSNPVNQSSYRLPLTVINLSSPFGWRNFGGVSEFHRGLDFAASMGTPIYAISDGVVLKAEYHYSWGNYVHIKHPDGRSSLYAHQSQLLVHVGQEVHQGDKIGLVGSTGNSTGAHLHLEISKSTSLAQGDLIDPATVLGLKK